MSGFPPAGGLQHGAGAHFHSLGERDTVAMQRPPLQTNSVNQAPLPAIAPRPSVQDDHLGLDPVHGMAGPGILGDSYDSYSYQYGGPKYPQDTSPLLQQNFPAHQGQWIANQVALDTEQPLRYFPSTTARPGFRKPGTGESDSGVDVSFPDRASESGPASEWGQSSTSSQTPGQAYTGRGGDGTTPPASAGLNSNIPRSIRWKQESPPLWGSPIPLGSEASYALPRAIMSNSSSTDEPPQMSTGSVPWLGNQVRGRFKKSVPACGILYHRLDMVLMRWKQVSCKRKKRVSIRSLSPCIHSRLPMTGRTIIGT